MSRFGLRLVRCLPAFALLASCAVVSSDRIAGPLRPLRSDTLENNGGGRDSDLLHVDVDLEIDFEARRVSGVVTNRIRALVDETSEITLHAVGLEIEAVLDSVGRPLRWELAEPLLVVQLAGSLDRGEEESLAVHYSARPERGLYFRNSSKDFDGFAPQVWTHGQRSDNRHWIPTWDSPNDRATCSGHFLVGEGMEALSNGLPVGVDEHPDGRRTYHWNLEQRIPTYLIALAAGRWEHYEDDWRGLSLEYFVAPGTGEEKARRAFGQTPRMLEFFTELLGVDFPYGRYAQAAVSEFLVGGMENASLTLLNDVMIEEPGGLMELSGEGQRLVAHELAHQWFGDLVTCFGWSNLWLNEAWASYLELAWDGEVDGPEAYALRLEHSRQLYLERTELLSFPLSEDWRSQVSERRCHHEYDKGPWVLHMLERKLGQQTFWRATNEFLERHADGLVTTADLARSVFDSTGHNVEGFFEQWVEGAGHPVYAVDFDAARARSGEGPLIVTVRQVQPTSELVPLFDATLVVELLEVEGHSTRTELRISEREQSFAIPLRSPLADLVFDVDCEVLCQTLLTKDIDMWCTQAHHSSAAVRWRALDFLVLAAEGRERSMTRARQAILRLASSDPEPLLRHRALVHGARYARTELLIELAVGDPDPMVRLKALRALRVRPLDPAQQEHLSGALADEKPSAVREAAGELLGS